MGWSVTAADGHDKPEVAGVLPADHPKLLVRATCAQTHTLSVVDGCTQSDYPGRDQRCDSSQAEAPFSVIA
jgi:hypothetical protein